MGDQQLKRYTSKPTDVEAIRWTGDNKHVLRSELKDVIQFNTDDQLHLLAGKDGAQGWVPVPVGHWIVRNPNDTTDYWPVEDEFFRGKYAES